MSKRKVSFSMSGAESSRKGEEKKSKPNEEEISSKEAKPFKLSHKEKELLKGDKAIERYTTDFRHRDIEIGRVVDLEWLESENDIEIDIWLNVVGWNNFVTVDEPVYPKLLRVLYANLNPLSMTSWIGKTEIKLGVDTWCNVFNIPNLNSRAEEPIRSKTKEELFKDLFGRDGLGVKSWVNLNELPTNPTIRLAANILMNVLVPKKGSKEQIKEEEGKILYTLKHGGDLNLAKEIVERIRQSTIRKTTPLCYGMHIMALLKRAGVDLKCAGDKAPITLKKSSHINARTLGRLGYKKDFNSWNYVGRGQVRRKFMGESSSHARERTEEASHERGLGEEEEGAAAESTAPDFSSMPHQPSSSAQFTSSTHLSRQLTNLQTFLSNQIAHLTSHMSEKLDYITATVNSRLENMDSKLDDLSLRVKSCEALLQPTQPTPTPPPKPSRRPKSTASKPTKPKPSSPSPPQPEESGGSPMFSMEELTRPSPQEQPSEPAQPPPSTQPQPSTQPTHSAPHTSESHIATQLVHETLKVSKTPRAKRSVSKASFKIIPK